MFFFLSKVMNFLLMPLSWAMILLVVSFFWKRRAQHLRLFSVAVIFVFGNSFLLEEVNRLWEIPVTREEKIQHHRVAVILGGYAYYSPGNDRVTFRKSTDRLMQGIWLYEQDKIDKLILSGGSGYLSEPDLKESLYVGDFLKEIDFPEGDLILESESRNTHENAVETAAILQRRGWDKERIVLVTSAYHMRRAQACFEKEGIEVVPFTADPATGERMFLLDHLLLPNAETMTAWNILIHEWVGYLTYMVMGYV